MAKVVGLFILLYSMVQGSLYAQTGPRITFPQQMVDKGDIYQGEKVIHTFEFTNTGDSLVLIERVISTCSCTSTDYTKTPIAPGGKGYVKVTFDSKDKQGKQTKPIRVIYNGGKFETVLMNCNVLPKK